MSTNPDPADEPEQSPYCYRCGEPLNGVCRWCGRSFCRRHGTVGEMLCRPHQIGCLAAWAVLIAAGIAAWCFFHR